MIRLCNGFNSKFRSVVRSRHSVHCDITKPSQIGLNASGISGYTWDVKVTRPASDWGCVAPDVWRASVAVLQRIWSGIVHLLQPWQVLAGFSTWTKVDIAPDEKCATGLSLLFSNTTLNALSLLWGRFLLHVGIVKFSSIDFTMLRPLYLKWEIPTFFSYGDEEVIWMPSQISSGSSRCGAKCSKSCSWMMHLGIGAW